MFVYTFTNIAAIATIMLYIFFEVLWKYYAIGDDK